MGNSPVTDEFPAQRANNAEYVSIWFRNHVMSRKMATIWQTIFLNAFSWMKIYIYIFFYVEAWFKYNWSLFLMVNESALVQVMVWCRTGNKPLTQSMMARFTSLRIRASLGFICWYSSGTARCHETHPYDIATVHVSHTDDLLTPPYDITTDVISYGRLNSSSVWHSNSTPISYGWLTNSSVWHNHCCYHLWTT